MRGILYQNTISPKNEVVVGRAMEILAEGLPQKSYFVLKNALHLPEREKLLQYFSLLLEKGNFRQAGIGGKGQIASEIRQDLISWADLESTPELLELSQFLSELKEKLNRGLFLGLQSFEGHFALYPVGARYRRHRDRFQSDDRRAVSLALYLNEEWREEDGGELVLHLPEGTLKILPQAGTLVLFLSDEIEHEVLPAKKPRKSFTGWFRRGKLL
jgi:SM-20-related protein